MMGALMPREDGLPMNGMGGRAVIEFHPVADIFPLMTGEEFEALKADIAANGLREPIWLHSDGRIIDGRNRYRACCETGAGTRFRTWDGQGTLVDFVVSLNLHRRHLSESQRAMVAARLANGSHGGDRRSDQVANWQLVSQLQAAELLGVSERSLSRANAVRSQGRPEVVQAVEQGALPVSVAAGLVREQPEFQEQVVQRVQEGMKPADAIRETRRAVVKAQVESTRALEVKVLEGVYDVIVIDPPWPMAKIERDERPKQAEFDYLTMSEAELRVLQVPCAANCHVWLWTTQKFLPLAFDLLEAWHLKYVCEFVWRKPGGFQPYGLPQFNCEFALYARRGSPQFIDTKAFNTCFDAPRGRHSEKPDAFYDMVRRVTAGRRLDMFSRRKIEGFDSWGKEAPDA